jgi:hypothetical protein
MRSREHRLRSDFAKNFGDIWHPIAAFGRVAAWNSAGRRGDHQFDSAEVGRIGGSAAKDSPAAAWRNCAESA